MLNKASIETMYRTKEGLGRWPHRGKVAAAGIGHSPTLRRWDGDPETSIGAWTILAIRRALEDAGLDAGEVDGLVLVDETSTGSDWPHDQPIPADFQARFKQTKDPLDGFSQLSPEWIIANMPELKGIKFVMIAYECMTMALTGAIEAVGEGMATTCLAVKGWHNFAGRYLHDDANSSPLISTQKKFANQLAGPYCYRYATLFQRYLHKYGKTHDMLAPFVVNSKKNGLLFPEGYWAQHDPKNVTVEDYLNARWIAKPANLLDNDIPVHTAAAYVITTGERARDLRQKPAYVLGHAGSSSGEDDKHGYIPPRGVIQTLEETEAACASTGRRLYEAAGITAGDVRFENSYDGFSFMHLFHLEGLGFASVKRGEGLDFYQTDISIRGPHPVSPSGGNIGSGRTRFWMHTDSIQQIQGRAGARQIAGPADIGISGGPDTLFSSFVVWAKSPD